MIRRRRFRAVVSAQLDLFEREHADVIDACEAAERAYDSAPREEAEERYSTYLDLVEEGAEILASMRDAYASRLDEPAADRYEAELNRVVERRLPRFARALADS